MINTIFKVKELNSLNPFLILFTILKNMPYKIRKAPNRDLYWVVKVSDGTHMSKEPIPLKRAEKQLIALRIAMSREK